MFRKMVLFFAFSSALLTAQYSATYGNLIRIPFDAVQINPADTVGSWYYRTYSYGDETADYIGIIHSPQITYFIKDIISYSIYTDVSTSLYLEDFTNQTSVYSGGWQGYNDVPEPYDIFITVPFRVNNGNWLMNGVYNTSFISDNGDVTIFPNYSPPSLLYISGKVGDKYLTVFSIDSTNSYDYFLLDLSNSPDFDTTGAERIYFDVAVTPYKLIQISGSLYIAGIDSLNFGPSAIYLFNLENNTFHFIKQFFYATDESWYYRDGWLFLYDYPSLLKYEYNPADTSFINETVIINGGGININRDFSFASQTSGNNLLIYNLNTAQLLNTIDISGLWNPGQAIVDSPYVYLSQTTGMTDVKDKSIKPLSYDLKIYPNPFNPSANIEYTIPERAIVHIKLFDILGREVREIFDGETAAGTHQVKIDGKELSSGIYFVNFVSGRHMVTKKIVLLK